MVERLDSMQLSTRLAALFIASQSVASFPQIAIAGEMVSLATLAEVDSPRLFGGSATPIGMLHSEVRSTGCGVTVFSRFGTLSIHRFRLHPSGA